jgi:hypothetical protein
LRKLRKHIAFFLFIIFILPITYHSLHVVWHHSHGYKGKQYLYNNIFNGINSYANKENILEEVNLCPIGEYQFIINDLPETSFSGSAIPVITYIYNKIAAQQQYKQVYLAKTPRAPPAFLYFIN